MSKPLRTYTCEGYGGIIAAYYAQVLVDWLDTPIEIRSRSALTDAEWLALAETLRPPKIESTIEVEAESGAIIGG
jgi:hypothetical protein